MSRSLISISDLTDAEIEKILDLSKVFAEVNSREIPKVPALKGKTVATLFFENSTRTRLSFELAASRLSADVITFSVAGSSVAKGESLRDTAETIESLGADLIVMRHPSSGSVKLVSEWLRVPMVNAGDGAFQHPTQGLLDAVTLIEHFKSENNLNGVRIGIIGDVIHSRVARSNIQLMSRLGAEVVLVGPPAFLPSDISAWPVKVSYSLDEVLPELDVLYLLRIQSERFSDAVLPSLADFSSSYLLSRDRLKRARKDAVVMHPGPVIRGVEIAHEIVDSERSLIRRQVENGVPVRMAVLYWLLAANEGKLDPAW